jgi:inner membrane protein
MGQEPTYTFSFVVAQSDGRSLSPTVPRQVGTRPDLGRGLPWLWRRMWGEPVPPPR